jgi:hypothetical protein
MTAAWLDEPQSGVNYKLSGDELLDVIRRAVKDNDWQLTMLGRGSIVMRRYPEDDKARGRPWRADTSEKQLGSTTPSETRRVSTAAISSA